MNVLEQQFEAAATGVHALANRPDNASLLRLYALYKQATEGDVAGPKPGFFDFIGNAKHDAWQALAGMPREQAMQAYIDLVNHLSAGAPSAGRNTHDET